MKIERKETEFQPIIITLQTQKDADILKDLVGRVVNSGPGRDFTSKLFDALDTASQVAPDTYFTGTISTKI